MCPLGLMTLLISLFIDWIIVVFALTCCLICLLLILGHVINVFHVLQISFVIFPGPWMYIHTLLTFSSGFDPPLDQLVGGAKLTFLMIPRSSFWLSAIIGLD